MMKNPVMFVVEVGCFITLLLSFLPGLFGDIATSNLRAVSYTHLDVYKRQAKSCQGLKE